MLRLLLIVLMLGGAQLSQASSPATVSVLASVEPLAAAMREVFAEAPHIKVRTLLLPNQNPHHASLTPGQAKLIRQADVLVWMGADAEPYLTAFVQRYAQRELALTAQANIQRLYEEDHGEQESAHLDPHLWLSPNNVLALVQGLKPLAGVLGLANEELEQAQARFAATLGDVTAKLEEALKPYQQVPYLSYHDAWGYFAENFSLQRALVVSASLEGEASSRHAVMLHNTMRENNIHCVVAEPESRKALLKRLCTGDCKLYQVDPLGRNEQAEWYTDFLLQIGEQFQACLAH